MTKARWYVFDGLGSVVGEVDPSGNLTSSPKYDVYGAVRSNGGTASSKQGFVGGLGHVSDDTGLIYMRARYYDSSVGRFISEDTIGDGTNWFISCSDNPVNYSDKTGKSPGAVNGINQEEASGGYFCMACSLICSYFLIRFGRTPIASAAYSVIGCAIGAELLADALKEVAPDGQTASVLIGVILNAVFNAAASSQGARSLLGGAVANVVAGYVAYYGICELYAYLSP